jgi:hypothetical protein
MSSSLFPLTMSEIYEDIESNDSDDIDININHSEETNNIIINYDYDFCSDYDFLVSYAVTMLIYVYAHFTEYIAKKYIH